MNGAERLHTDPADESRRQAQRAAADDWHDKDILKAAKVLACALIYLGDVYRTRRDGT